MCQTSTNTMTNSESGAAQKQRAAKNVTVLLFLGVNGTWIFFAYLLYKIGLRPGLIAGVVVLGAVLGNVSTYAGVRLAAKILRRR